MAGIGTFFTIWVLLWETSKYAAGKIMSTVADNILSNNSFTVIVLLQLFDSSKVTQLAGVLVMG